MQLKNLIEHINTIEINGSDEKNVANIQFDSRKVAADTLFVAVKGVAQDGHAYIAMAEEKGATTIVCEELPELQKENVTYVRVEDSALALGELASVWYDHPSKKLKLVGITGTNGKTTCATLLYNLCETLGAPSILLSTIRIKVHKETIPSTHTTPDILRINEILAQGVAAGCQFAFMEVSSHGIHQQRIAGLHFAIAGFTNITHDHLDYHETFKNYLSAKKKFFDDLSKEAVAITNLDDKNGIVMMQNTQAKKETYALKTLADYKAKVLELRLDGMLLHFNGKEFWTQLTGKFNVYNLLLVFGIARNLGFVEGEILQALSTLGNVDGRFQSYLSEDGITAIVDYAHTPDALKNVLQTIEDLRSRNETLFTVFGCGGDRDQDKRPGMGAIAVKYSDQVLVTSDNPRTEKPNQIIKDIMEGISLDNKRKCLEIEDREQAIKTAITMAKEGDIILVAGKGHENYQEINGERHHFDDMEMVIKYFNELKK